MKRIDNGPKSEPDKDTRKGCMSELETAIRAAAARTKVEDKPVSISPPDIMWS